MHLIIRLNPFRMAIISHPILPVSSFLSHSFLSHLFQLFFPLFNPNSLPSISSVVGFWQCAMRRSSPTNNPPSPIFPCFSAVEFAWNSPSYTWMYQSGEYFGYHHNSKQTSENPLSTQQPLCYSCIATKAANVLHILLWTLLTCHLPSCSSYKHLLIKKQLSSVQLSELTMTLNLSALD